ASITHKQAAHGVEHVIKTTGPPVSSKARRLCPEKLKAAKQEFEFMTAHIFYTVFSTINLVRAYQQIPVRESDIPKTAIITPFGLFEFSYMTFGFRSTNFQRFMDQVTVGLDFCFTYIDESAYDGELLAIYMAPTKIPVSDTRFEHVHIDIVGPLPPSKSAHVGKEALRAGINVIDNVENNKPLKKAVKSRLAKSRGNLKRKAKEKISFRMRDSRYKISATLQFLLSVKIVVSKLNSFNFKNYGINFFSLYADVMQIPNRPLQPNFSKDKPLYVEAYHHSLAESNFINRDDYAYTLFAFDFTPDLSSLCPRHWNFVKHGSLRLEVRFEKVLFVIINCIVYIEFDNSLEIDSSCQIIVDFSD
ncbi:POL5 protein, partial [Pseudoatta argentina]